MRIVVFVMMMIAEHIGGNEADFAGMMNTKAASLGMIHTHFSHRTACAILNTLIEYMKKDNKTVIEVVMKSSRGHRDLSNKEKWGASDGNPYPICQRSHAQ